MKLLEAKHLTYSYDGKTNVVDDVSFIISEGSYTSIIGHNGSGKSTIAKLLLGLLSPNKDSLNAFGLEYNKKNIREIRQHIGIVFQNPDNQFIGATVRDDIAFGLENRRIPQKQMDDIINKFAAKVNMMAYLDKEPEHLSGGQKQRVAIAGVLAMKPDIIIFDEASSMLDPKGKSEIRETIEVLRKENPKMAIISITHDVEEAFDSDRIIVLNKGKIEFDSKPSDLLKHKEKLIAIGLDIPFMERLHEALKANGLDEISEALK